jgi:dihydrolipoamide dehydrogenase
LIENGFLGGTCLNRGCIPLKTMLYTAELYRGVTHLKDYGIEAGSDVDFDFDVILKKRDLIMEKLRKGLAFLLKKDGVTVIEGYAEVINANTVSVLGEAYEAEYLILATGSKAKKFAGFIDNDLRFLVYDDVFKMKEFPKSILIVGGGAIGVEFASYFNSFGTKVYIVDSAPNFLGSFDVDLSNELIKIFTDYGIECRREVQIQSIEAGAKNISATLSNGESIEIDYVLSACGVSPDLTYLKVDLEKNKDFVHVDETFKTSVNQIFAIGDVNGLSGTAYGAEREGLIVAKTILSEDCKALIEGYKCMPDVVFSNPEVACVGLTEKQCEERNIAYMVKSSQFMVNGKAVLKDATRGICKIIVTKEDHKVLGVHIIGDMASEVISSAVLPVFQGLTVKQWLNMVWSHPVINEIIKDVLLQF